MYNIKYDGCLFDVFFLSKTFSRNSNLVRHIAQIHSEFRESKPPTSHSFICEFFRSNFFQKAEP